MQEDRILISSWWLWVNTICWVMDGMETMFYHLAVLTLKSNSYYMRLLKQCLITKAAVRQFVHWNNSAGVFVQTIKFTASLVVLRLRRSWSSTVLWHSPGTDLHITWFIRLTLQLQCNVKSIRYNVTSCLHLLCCGVSCYVSRLFP